MESAKMDDDASGFIQQWESFIRDLKNLNEVLLLRLPRRTGRALYDLLERVSHDALRAGVELAETLDTIEQKSTIRGSDLQRPSEIFHRLRYEFILASAAFKRIKTPKGATAACDVGKTLVETIQKIYEKGGDQLPILPWFALQFLGEGLDFAKALIPTMRAKRRQG